MKTANLPPALTAGNLCDDCAGTGADATKTATARKAGRIDGRAYVRCWTCNGNGLVPTYPSRLGKPIRPAITVERGNDLHFPRGNERGEFWEPMWFARCGTVAYAHGRTPFLALLGCARQVRAYRNRTMEITS